MKLTNLSQVWAELQRFGFVGGIGFAVDATVLQTLVSRAHWSPYTARILSFGLAVTVTFVLNRLWTFRHRRTRSKTAVYVRYFLVQVTGALINLLVFYLCLNLVPPLHTWPIFALAVGSAVALFFTFSASRRFVFVDRARTIPHSR